MLAVVAVLFGFTGTEEASAQAGEIRGRVIGDAGPIQGAAVTLERRAVPVARAVTDAGGVFTFSALTPGTYAVRAQALGHEAPGPREVVVGPGATAELTIRLREVAVELEAVDVVGGPAVRVERESTEMGTEIHERMIRLLPTSHDPADLVALVPGARPGHVWGGASDQANSYQLDGLAANHPGVGGDLIQPSVHWIERVEVRGLGAGAEHGNFQGGLVNLVTKSGTNLFQGALHTNVESHHLNGSNLVMSEIGSEVDGRLDLEGELRGPVVEDRLFFFVAGQVTRRDVRHVDHLAFVNRSYIPALEEAGESKFFGKLTWRPRERDLVEVSGGFLGSTIDRFGMTGYEAPEAALRRSAPTVFYNAIWSRDWSGWLSTDLKGASYSYDETREPYLGPEVPGIQHFGYFPPYSAYGNAPIRYRHNPASSTGSASATLRFVTGGWEHQIRFGGEHVRGSFLDQRLRNGGMTWRPPKIKTVDPGDPATWPFSASKLISITTGAEVDLDADVENSALFAQGSFSLGDRLTVNPGLRAGWWKGWLNPRDGESFLAVQDQAIDPRIGVIVDVDGKGSLLAKAHWGRFHQSMLAQFFDRVEGGNVFSDERLWQYYGPPPTSPQEIFTVEELEAMRATGQSRVWSEVILSETGPVKEYRQPYIDQLVLGLEKGIGSWLKFEAAYVQRQNRDMVALVDLNRDVNYTGFHGFRVYNASGQKLEIDGGGVFLDTLFVRNDFLRQRIRCKTLTPDECDGVPAVPGMTAEDTLNLAYIGPDYVLTTAPGARREFQQLQVSMELSRASWGATASYVLTDLRGNLDNVTGYEDPAGYGPGPYVRINERVNRFGRLPNYSPRQAKLAVYGMLPFAFSGGMYWTRESGDHYTSLFTLSGTGLYHYMQDKEFPGDCPRFCPPRIVREVLDYRFFAPMERHTVHVGRVRPHLRDKLFWDVHLEREFEVGGNGLSVTLDVFNVLNFATVTEVNPSMNRGRNYYEGLGPDPNASLFRPIEPNEYYRAVLGRVPPRTLRLGTTFRF